MFFRRDAAGEDRWLPVKIAIFVVGAVLAVAGIAFHQDWVVWAAVIVLAVGVLLRALGDRGP